MLRKFARAAALCGLIMLAATPAAPAVSPALLAPSSLTPIPTPVPKGPRIYKLPWGGGQSHDVCQGNNHAGSTHTGLASYAWDFCMPIGTAVGAARGGTVKAVRQDSNTGGWNPKYVNDANYIVVDHGDGTSGLYMHLMFNGARVKVGDQVQTGQLLGYSGDTGWTSAPHLHFMVMQTSSSDYYTQSVPVLFTDVPDNGGLPLEDHTYASGNALLDTRMLTIQGPPPFTPFWVETFRSSTLWSGTDEKAIKFGSTPPWQFFDVVAPQVGPRLQVIAAATGATAFVPAADVGPSGPPPSSKEEAATPTAPRPATRDAASPPAGQVVVAAGDTLYAIARAHAITMDKLISLNGLANPNALTVGELLKVG